MPGKALAVPHPMLSSMRRSRQPAVGLGGLGVGGWEGGSLLTDDVEFLSYFQVAPGLEGESYIRMKSNGVRGGGETGNRDREKGLERERKERRTEGGREKEREEKREGGGRKRQIHVCVYTHMHTHTHTHTYETG